MVLLDLVMPGMDRFDFVAAERLNGSPARVLQKGAPSRETLLGEVRDLVAASARHGRHLRYIPRTA